MFLQKYIHKNNFFDLNIFISSFLIIFFKWAISFLLFKDENLVNKVLFDISDVYYFPFILNFLELNFSPDYLLDIKSENLIPIPIYSILIHAIFFKIFGLFGFFILELFFLYIFLIIIHKILLYCKINYFLALTISLFIFIIPSLFANLQLMNINLSIVNGIFSFRFPRPLVTSCYFFWGIYLALQYYKDDKFDLKKFLLIGVCLSLVFVSYYYNFISLFILFIFLFVNKILNIKDYFKNNYLSIFLSVLIFLLLTLPYLYIYSLSEKDFSSMMGVIDLNFDLRIKLLMHFLSKIFTFKFIIVFLLITFLRFFLLKSQNQINEKIIKFFYFFFLATLISPFFFTIFSPSISEIYHFLNWIVITSILVLIIYFSLFINFKLLKINKLFFLPLSFFLILLFQFIHYENLNNDNKYLRKDYLNLQKLIDLNTNELETLLSFSIRSQVLWMLKDKKKFASIESSVSSLSFDQLEQNFIQNLKFLNISNNEFFEIISNKKGSWRYSNEYIKYISWYKYRANSLVTFESSKDFDENELKYILNSSPTKTQQIILPKFEIERLVKTYKTFNSGSNFENPDLIILKKDSLISKYVNLENDLYCELSGFNNLKIFILRELEKCT